MRILAHLIPPALLIYPREWEGKGIVACYVWNSCQATKLTVVVHWYAVVGYKKFERQRNACMKLWCISS